MQLMNGSASVYTEGRPQETERGFGRTSFLGQEDGTIVLSFPSIKELPKLMKELKTCQ